MKNTKLINVPIPQRTSSRKAGRMLDYIGHGAKIVIAANFLWPDFDQALFEQFIKFIAGYKPDRIYFLGRMMHDVAFQLMAHGAMREAEREETEPNGISDSTSKHAPQFAQPVIDAKASSEVWEERILTLGKLAGDELLIRVVEAAGSQCHLFYIPALEGTHQTLPPESNILYVLKSTQAKLNASRHAENKEFVGGRTLPIERKDFAQLLGVEQHPRIHVRPFGSRIILGCLLGQVLPEDTEETLSAKVFSNSLLEVGKRKVKNPIGEAYESAKLNRVSTVQGYAPQLSNGWFTLLTSAGESSLERTYLSFHQVGMMFARERMDFGDSALERYASGFFVGYNWRGTLHGQTIPFLRGADGRRAIHAFSHRLAEDKAGGLGRTDVFISP
ncbi:hypothetical protein BH10CYA1_BH10CYA1_53420 [soil metagenome]